MSRDLGIYSRMAPGGTSKRRHAAKARFPDEALCGRVLAPVGQRAVPDRALRCSSCMASYALGAR